MCTTDEKLNICLIVDDGVIYEFNKTINENSIIHTAKSIEDILINNNAKASKIKNVYEILIEIMQNILNYSYGNIDLSDNRKEATGSISLSYKSEKDVYLLQTCNLVDADQKEEIKDRLYKVRDLDDKQLRKLARQKMRSREDNHEKGAGLGFITIARKCSEPIFVEFTDIGNKIEQVIFKFVI